MASFIQTLRERLFRGLPVPVGLLTLALLGGGLIGGVANFLLLDGFWPWDMPPLAYRFLAGAATAYVAGSLVTLSRARWVESELLGVTVLIYGVVLVAAIVMQLDLIDWTELIAWLFVIVVSFALVVVVVYVWQKRGEVQFDTAQAIGRDLRAFLLALGIAASVVGAWVYFAPKQAGLIWPWSALDAWKLLDSRLIASMLLTIGGGAFVALWRNDRGAAQVFLAMLWAYCLVAGIGIALHAAATPAFAVPDITYVVIFSAIVLVSFALYARDQRRAGYRAG